MRADLTREAAILTSVACAALCVLFFLLTTLSLAVVIFPSLLVHIVALIVVTVASVAASLVLTLPQAGETSGRTRFGSAVLLLVLYAAAAGLLFRDSFPVVASLPFAAAGLFATSTLIDDYSAFGSLLKELPMWQAAPERYEIEQVQDTLRRFDARVRRANGFLAALYGVILILLLICLILEKRVPTIVYVAAAPFVWLSMLLFLFSRILKRLERLYIEGYPMDAAAVLQPVVLAGAASLIVVVVAAVAAPDTSILHYSTLVSALTTFGRLYIGRSEQMGASAGPESGAPETAAGDRNGAVPPGSAEAGAAAPGVGADAVGRSLGTASDVVGDVFRIVLVAVAVVSVVTVVYLSIRRSGESGDRPARATAGDHVRRAVRTLRLMLERFGLLLREVRHRLRLVFGKTGKRRSAREDAEVGVEVVAAGRESGSGPAKRLEKNMVLRYYKRLVRWAERRGVPYRPSSTSEQVIHRLQNAFPADAAALHRVGAAFETAFYSPERLGRGGIRQYVRDVKSIMSRKSG